MRDLTLKPADRSVLGRIIVIVLFFLLVLAIVLYTQSVAESSWVESKTMVWIVMALSLAWAIVTIAVGWARLEYGVALL
jgi:small-conductance mechanosensitive channel